MSRTKNCNRVSAILVLSVLILAGCSSDGPVDPDPIVDDDQSSAPFAGSEDQLMANFRTAYEDMGFKSCRDMLHPDFELFLLSSTTDRYLDVGPTLDRQADLRCTERMFSGSQVTDPTGGLVAGISSISLDQLEQQGAWTTSLPTDVLPDTRVGLFEVVFRIDRPGYSSLIVQGQIKFYVAGQDSFHDGADRTYWRFIGQQDRTQDGYGKGLNTVAWGSLKVLFR